MGDIHSVYVHSTWTNHVASAEGSAPWCSIGEGVGVGVERGET